MKRLSIIIVTYNSEKHIFDCVSSIKRHSDLPLEEVELIIVDNNSKAPQPMFDQLQQIWGDDIVLINNPINGGYGQGNNLGIRQSTAPVVLIMNPDVRLYEPIFSKAVMSFDRNKKQGMLGMVQMQSESKRSNHSFTPTWMMNGYLHLALYSICNRMDWYMPSCMSIQGSCFFLRKEMFIEAGMFDESNFMYGEEEDIHYRMKKLFGAECFAFDKSMRYIHLPHNRPASLEYEKRLLDTDIALYEKKGVDTKLILKHYLQNNRPLLWRARLKSSPRYGMLKQFNQHLRELLNKY